MGIVLQFSLQLTLCLLNFNKLYSLCRPKIAKTTQDTKTEEKPKEEEVKEKVEDNNENEQAHKRLKLEEDQETKRER